jgi:acetylornithine deacetylase/succinyl-diaminopimelate desuccinylase-like protein
MVLSMSSVEAFSGPTTELLQTLIRNQCVNDGRPESGEERRNADVLQTYLEGAGLDVQRFESRPGRTSIVARIEGRDPEAPALCLMGHTDVVPVNPDGWSHDPFSAELIDGEVWGRGAVDMLNITSSMAIAFRQLASEGFRPEGSLIYFGVADEEAGGRWGAEYMVDNHWDAVGAKYVLTESGGWSQKRGDGTHSITVNVAEKGLSWRRLRIAGTPGHGSMPYGADNALITAAEVVRRLVAFRTRPNLDDLWNARLDAIDLPDDLRAALSDPATVDDAIATLPPQYARVAHACSHTTISPNVIHGGQKTNTIPDVIEMDVDMRTVPGDTKEVVDGYLAEALGDLAARVEVSPLQEADSTRSPVDNPLWDAVTTCTKAVYPEARVIPGLITGGTDARFFRLRGSVAYGAALFSPEVTIEEFSSRFHGNDERIDTHSLGLSADFWYHVAKQLVG